MTVAPVYHIISQSLILTALVHCYSLVLMLEWLLMADNYTVTIFASNGCPGTAVIENDYCA